ncbi:LysR substrate-binding domain-containing protein [Janthinobacterium agaricidamnosum]|uniref:Bacterial regulatory helix-turn-helix, lysR family protein n=1 Tax=Janthinobacterium agaricidamnosum NBRC 102515 = DSM 9628 TaxID=1349767 RepID=W0VC84_9BURK|nr:LysR substrate-binding domain-containing protein [Janthinobacterium agaricidamnosum]CDG85270.1 bacterial regulatory helix-turn-helix, lysR family protein [Janthinobacterium agaricidamnosum NBRC 102515 = DSM 9628]
MRFDLVDLQLFLQVAETGSLTAGAERSHMALASASARVRGMEEELGMPLLVRGRRGVAPTPAGQTLLHHARLVLRQIDKMRGELGEYGQGLKGHIRLLSNTAALSEFLPEALGAFMERYPNVNVDLEERLSDDIVKAVVDGAADVGIVSDSVDMSGLQTFPFRQDRLVAIVAANQAANLTTGEHGTVDFAGLLDFDFIGLAGGSALHQYLSLHAARAGRRLKVRVRLRSFDAICRMVENGVGISVVPQSAALRCALTMAIRIVGLSDAWSVRNLTICVRQFDELPLYTRQLVEEIQTTSGE